MTPDQTQQINDSHPTGRYLVANGPVTNIVRIADSSGAAHRLCGQYPDGKVIARERDGSLTLIAQATRMEDDR